jgi:hypothetical protein
MGLDSISNNVNGCGHWCSDCHVRYFKNTEYLNDNGFIYFSLIFNFILFFNQNHPCFQNVLKFELCMINVCYCT